MRPIAFYAPLKTPNHPTPSGDRQIARNVMSALEHGFDRPVQLASELRSFEPAGDAAAQQRITDQAQAECDRILGDAIKPVIWITYHNYYKAPDLLGPVISKALGIPYVQIEASRAKSRLTGPWADFAQAAHAASDAADVIFHVTQDDLIALQRDRFGSQRIVELPPFLDRDIVGVASDLSGPMLAVGMMRAGDKLASYQLIAQTLAALTHGDWALDIAGDGHAREEVETLFAPFGDKVQFLGALVPDALERLYRSASLFFWPGVNEAFGMVYLEAQASGLPILAQDRPGVRDVLMPGIYPSPESGPSALANRLQVLLRDRPLRQDLGQQAQAYVQRKHLRPAAIDVLRKTLRPLIAEYA